MPYSAMTQIMSALAQKVFATQDLEISCLSKNEILLGEFLQVAALVQESYFCFEEKPEN